MLLLALSADGLVGSVHLKRESDGAYLGMLVVAPTLQGRGIGKRFLAEAERTVRDRWGARWMRMRVIAVRRELIEFYERRGYRPTGERTPLPVFANSRPLVQGLEFETLLKRF